jgi:hypothetical protein
MKNCGLYYYYYYLEAKRHIGHTYIDVMCSSLNIYQNKMLVVKFVEKNKIFCTVFGHYPSKTGYILELAQVSGDRD